MHHYRHLVIFAIFFLILSKASLANNAPDLAWVGALWVAESDGVLKVATMDGRVLFTIANGKNIEAVAVDEKNGRLWAYGCGDLAAYQFDGTLLLSVDVIDRQMKNKKKEDDDRHKKNLILNTVTRITTVMTNHHR